ncbi:MAG: hypothetical protein JST86_02055 [Bacteroidetes bacterium]|nr:hypothetical protein [Bacteroidota bacterium]
MITENAQHNGTVIHEREDTPVYKSFSPITILAHLFSVVFHPLFIPVYVVAFLLFVHPSYFSGFSPRQKYWVLFSAALNTIFFPAFSLVLMKGLGFIKSIFLRTQQDRIGPYLSSMIFYFWTAWTFFKMEPKLPLVLPVFMTGVFLTTVVGLLTNISFKISMHGMGIGGLIGIFIIIMFQNTMWMAWPLSLALLIGGLVCTSRLVVSNHSPRDIYLGLLAGLFCQFIAAAFIL